MGFPQSCDPEVVPAARAAWIFSWRTFTTDAAMTKIKGDPEGREAQAEACSGERTYQELLVNLNPIAQPLASRRLTRKLYKCIKKGAVGRDGRGGCGLLGEACSPPRI